MEFIRSCYENNILAFPFGYLVSCFRDSVYLNWYIFLQADFVFIKESYKKEPGKKKCEGKEKKSKYY